MSVFDQSLDRVIPITHELLIEDGWKLTWGAPHDMRLIICGCYEKSFYYDAILCTLVAIVNHNNELIYKISFYDEITGSGFRDCTELTYMDHIDIILQRHGII